MRDGCSCAIGVPTSMPRGLPRPWWATDEGGRQTAGRLVAVVRTNGGSVGPAGTTVRRRRGTPDLRRSRQHVRTGHAAGPRARRGRQGQRADGARRLHRLHRLLRIVRGRGRRRERRAPRGGGAQSGLGRRRPGAQAAVRRRAAGAQRRCYQGRRDRDARRSRGSGANGSASARGRICAGYGETSPKPLRGEGGAEGANGADGARSWL